MPESPTIRQHWLVIKANGDVRLHRKEPTRLGLDQVCVPITVNFPGIWGKTLTDQAIGIEMPDPPIIRQEGALPPAIGEPAWRDDEQATA